MYQNMAIWNLTPSWTSSICHISSYSFRRNYSFLNLEIVANSNSCHNISIFYLVNRNFCCGKYSREESIHGRKLFKGGNYMRKYGSQYWYPNCLIGISCIYLSPFMAFFGKQILRILFNKEQGLNWTLVPNFSKLWFTKPCSS